MDLVVFIGYSLEHFFVGLVKEEIFCPFLVCFLLYFDFQNSNLEWFLVPKGRLSTSIGHHDSTSHAYVPLAAEGLKK